VAGRIGGAERRRLTTEGLTRCEIVYMYETAYMAGRAKWEKSADAGAQIAAAGWRRNHRATAPLLGGSLTGGSLTG
jgi:hypothetical protein